MVSLDAARFRPSRSKAPGGVWASGGDGTSAAARGGGMVVAARGVGMRPPAGPVEEEQVVMAWARARRVGAAGARARGRRDRERIRGGGKKRDSVQSAFLPRPFKVATRVSCQSHTSNFSAAACICFSFALSLSASSTHPPPTLHFRNHGRRWRCRHLQQVLQGRLRDERVRRARAHSARQPLPLLHAAHPLPGGVVHVQEGGSLLLDRYGGQVEREVGEGCGAWARDGRSRERAKPRSLL
jgi:hypothetical protein